jgi:aminoglycoside phosphotransferase (APT) family kinase protein
MGSTLSDDVLAGIVQRGGLRGAIIDVAAVGNGQVAQCRRVVCDDDGDITSAIVKSPSADETSRSTARAQHLYRRETSFYRELQPHVDIRTPAPSLVEYTTDDDTFALVLEDLTPGTVVDQFAGLTVEQATLALSELAGLHAPTLDRDDIFAASWLQGVTVDLAPLYEAVVPGLFDGFLDRYDDVLAPATREMVSVLRNQLFSLWGRDVARQSVTHGDYRCENLIFDGRAGEVPLTVVDWQTVSAGSPFLDVAYLIVTSLTTERRREHEHSLVAHYLSEMAARGAPLSAELARHDVARYTLQPIGMLVSASMIVERTDRGDAMFLTMIDRAVDAAADWDAFAELAS